MGSSAALFAGNLQELISSHYRRPTCRGQASCPEGEYASSVQGANAVDGEKNTKKLKVKRDKKLTSDAGLKSWEGKKVQAFLHCHECGKRRCIYTRLNKHWGTATGAFAEMLASPYHKGIPLPRIPVSRELHSRDDYLPQ